MKNGNRNSKTLVLNNADGEVEEERKVKTLYAFQGKRLFLKEPRNIR